MSVRASRRDASEQINRLCATSIGDSIRLRTAVLDQVRRPVPFDAHVWLLTDPATTVGTAPLADVPCLPELPRLIRCKYLSRTNRWTSLKGPATVQLADVTGDGWADLLRRHGTTAVASVPFRDHFGLWGWLDLWRAGGPFTPEELAWLDGVTSPVTSALRTAQAATFRSPAVPAVPAGPFVLLLSGDLQVLEMTPQTRDYLDRLVPPSPGRDAVPANAYNVAAQLLAVKAGVDRHPAYARTHLAGGVWVTVRAGDLGGGTGRIAVTIETATPQERLPVFTRAFGLTRREAAVVECLAAGADTRGLVRRLGISEHTVQDHLKAVFAKTSTRSRAALLALAVHGETGT